MRDVDVSSLPIIGILFYRSFTGVNLFFVSHFVVDSYRESTSLTHFRPF
jgi:hypothetical protein